MLTKRSSLGLLLAVVAATPGVARAAPFEDNPLIPSPSNPLLTKGPSGSIDSLKIGPRAVLRQGPNDWKIWYEAVPAGNQSSTALATSSDGITWTKYAGNPVMLPSEPWEGGPDGEASPISILKEDGLYKLWYHGFDDGVRQIGHATSPDGLTWTKYAGNPVLSPGAAGQWDADSVCEGQVVRVGDLYHMYYSRCTGSHGIGVATSRDGVTWTKYADNPIVVADEPWADKQVAWAEVFFDGTGFHMWYPGVSFADATIQGHSLGYASSPDGMVWTKSPNNPVMSPSDPSLNNPSYDLNQGDAEGLENRPNVLRRGAKWWIYYGGFAYCCPEDATLCLATTDVVAAPNKPPVVDAGAAQDIDPGTVASLDGTVMDDDFPIELALVSASWTKERGPGNVTFADPSAIDTTATFAAEGLYRLRLTADDTQAIGSAVVEIVVGRSRGEESTSDASEGGSVDETGGSPATSLDDDGGSGPRATSNAGDDPGDGSQPRDSDAMSTSSATGESGGCGCTHAGAPVHASWAWFALAGIRRRTRAPRERVRPGARRPHLGEYGQRAR